MNEAHPQLTVCGVAGKPVAQNVCQRGKDTSLQLCHFYESWDALQQL